MGDGDTTIRISRDTWQRLHDRKQPGMSHDDVISGLLDQADSTSEVTAES